MSPDLIDAAVAAGAKGIVIAGVGDGNMTSPALEAVKRAVAKGVVVVRSSRTGRGIIRRNVEVSDDQLGTVASMDLNPGKARVLLQLALTKSQRREEGPGVLRPLLNRPRSAGRERAGESGALAVACPAAAVSYSSPGLVRRASDRRPPRTGRVGSA